MRKSPLALLAGLIAVLGFSAAASADDFSTRAQASAEALFMLTKSPGMVIAVVDGDKSYVDGFGETEKGNGIRPDGRSVVRLASISKLMTSDVLSSMVADRTVSLADTLQSHAPTGRIVPVSRKGQPITLLNLATHTSGLPREPLGAPWDWLSTVKVNRLVPAGLYIRYSNVAFDLLSGALEDAAAKPYPVLLRERVTQPLGMIDTMIVPDDDECSRLMISETGPLNRPCMDMSIMGGSGGVYSTAADMTMWMRHQLDIDGTPQDMRRQISQKIYFRRGDLQNVQGIDHAGPASGMGLGWVELQQADGMPQVLEKTGCIGGFMTYIAIVPGRQVGVFAAINIVTHNDMKVLAEGVNQITIALASPPAAPTAPTTEPVIFAGGAGPDTATRR